MSKDLILSIHLEGRSLICARITGSPDGEGGLPLLDMWTGARFTTRNCLASILDDEAIRLIAGGESLILSLFYRENHEMVIRLIPGDPLVRAEVIDHIGESHDADSVTIQKLLSDTKVFADA